MKTSSSKNEDKISDKNPEGNSEGNVSLTNKSPDDKNKILRNQTRHLSFEQEKEPKNIEKSEIEPLKEKSLNDLNNKSVISNGDPDYQHSLSPTSKVKMRAEIFIHLKLGSIDSSYTIGELLGEGQVSFIKNIH